MTIILIIFLLELLLLPHHWPLTLLHPCSIACLVPSCVQWRDSRIRPMTALPEWLNKTPSFLEGRWEDQMMTHYLKSCTVNIRFCILLLCANSSVAPQTAGTVPHKGKVSGPNNHEAQAFLSILLMVPSTSGVLELIDLLDKNRVWHEMDLDSNFKSTTHQLCEFQ